MPLATHFQMKEPLRTQVETTLHQTQNQHKRTSMTLRSSRFSITTGCLELGAPDWSGSEVAWLVSQPPPECWKYANTCTPTAYELHPQIAESG